VGLDADKRRGLLIRLRHRDGPARTGTLVTFGESRQGNRLLHRFRRAGLRKGDVVANLIKNAEHIHAIMWVAQRSGGGPRELKEEENNNPRVFHRPC